MIIRERDDSFVMIRQHDHAIISEKIISKLKNEFLPEEDWRRSVFYAIKMHDYGWENFDAVPIWNDEDNSPYSFIDYPNQFKTVLYKHGIDEVAKEDAYAALLCSKHYALFIGRDSSSTESREFLENEEVRQRAIQEQLDYPNEEIVNFHFELLKLADDLSLYLCLNEPGASIDEIHSFFKDGIHLPQRFEKQFGEKLQLECVNEQLLTTTKFPFQEEFSLSIPYKTVSKEAIREKGIRKSYEEAEENNYQVVVSEGNQ